MPVWRPRSEPGRGAGRSTLWAGGTSALVAEEDFDNPPEVTLRQFATPDAELEAGANVTAIDIENMRLAPALIVLFTLTRFIKLVRERPFVVEREQRAG